MSMLQQSKQWLRTLLLDARYFWILAALVLTSDAALTQLIIRFVPYTEIDFETYMYQVEVFEKGERDYSLITGPSGPLVYPAGHVLIHRFLAYLTSGGSNISLVQQIYGFLYICSAVLTCAIYRQAGGVPNYILLLLPLSKRLHSLFMLRLFNDCWALVAIQAATLAYAKSWDDLGSVLFSSALSVKMSILLYLPGLLVLLFKRHGLLHTIRHIFTIISFQILVALPFLCAHPWTYLTSAFEFSRVFLYKWTVNWRFLSEEAFLSKPWALILLAGHLGTLIAFAAAKWCRSDGGVWSVIERGLRNPSVKASLTQVSADQFITVLFTSNLIGILLARSLHYQFYSWYAQQLPFLLWRTCYPTVVRMAILAGIEYAWNVFPSTTISSSALVASNVALLVGIWFGWPEGKAHEKVIKSKRS